MSIPIFLQAYVPEFFSILILLILESVNNASYFLTSVISDESSTMISSRCVYMIAENIEFTASGNDSFHLWTVLKSDTDQAFLFYAIQRLPKTQLEETVRSSDLMIENE